MPKIQLNKQINNNSEIECHSGENLMEILLINSIPVASSCHGDGVCSKCRIQINQGMENLSLISDYETQLKQKNKIPECERISCMTLVYGDVSISTRYW